MYPRLQKIQFVICAAMLFLIAFGAVVRIGNAGLSCPDWPLCFGQWVPPLNIRVFLEWFHRLIAGSLGIAALLVSLYIWTRANLSRGLKLLCCLSIVIFFIQAWLGGQTVIQLLRTEIVTSHLIGGYSLFTVNAFIYFRLSRSQHIEQRDSFGRFTSLLVLIALGQAILGALVSSHYAGLACGSEFPTCNGSWLPALNGIIGIHFVHRWNAFLLMGLLMTGFALSRMLSLSPVVRSSLRWALVLIGIQIILGISMIFTTIHPGFAASHALVSASLFAVLLRGMDHVYYR